YRKIGIVFAILLTLCFGFIFNAVQSNTISQSFMDVFNIPDWLIGLVLVILAGIVIFGGFKRIVKVNQLVVPIIEPFYLIVVLYIGITNSFEVLAVFTLIVDNAVCLVEVVGGVLGAGVMQGVRRGLFSNGACMVSMPNAAASANVSHPAKQGVVQSLGVFFD